MLFEKGNIPWNKGRSGLFKHTEETKKKISRKLKERKLTEEHKERIGMANKGKPNIWAGKKRPEISKRMKGENNPMYGKFGAQTGNWKGGKGEHKGYVVLTINGKVFREHVLIAEKALGRKMNKGEVVHHINGKRSDNRNCNLLICTKGYHTWLHNRMAQLYIKEHLGGV